MAPPKITVAGNPVLRSRAADVPDADFGTRALRSFVKGMVQAMRDAPGVGLAAPQLGVGVRALVMEDSDALMSALGPEERRERERVALPLTVVLNPVLRPIGSETRVFFEGCLSVPGFMALVERHRAVELEGRDVEGLPIALSLVGWPARIAQHEVDHLDGTLYVDRMMPRTFGSNPEIRERWLHEPVAEVRRKLGA